ncbi:bis(5'-nucleosyl)-tetraphosphatase PrpE [asymmetrical]-like [Dreissena polymorpha]|uniref:Calcineurin-like phosphoesterase domain-containing protein n=1 Tax=Dreissena polymorpha TaxID=45954 RepID=A0A9D4S0P8_DREPO|nr:bis(5'-nucleosyl)-tetraphosphatase PrpE [asymmetrical]-like [Dreissena polymorpha]XP_052225014.1 bis(5'-nucleosyl)-tetraphosphatase PrpE [asymmetrical]-like [Dreissena polymorpha]KAH3885572.1 hypothetical protein DPMN_009567 [Dreissena polymorpha]
MAAIINIIWSFFIKQSAPVRGNLQNNPLPPRCHIELSADDIAGRSVFVIGDVHGCYDELQELMRTATDVAPNIMFILVGDLVNRGPDSVAVVREVSGRSGQVYAVRGNHDESAIRQARLYRENPNYILPEKYSWVKDLNDHDYKFLNELPYTISLPSLDALVVHAGLIPCRSLELQMLNDLTNIRNIVIDDEGTLTGTNSHADGIPWIKTWRGPEHVYFGHDARRKLQEEPFGTGLDTGCCHGGSLTGKFINGPNTFLSVKSKQPNPHV